MTIQIRRLVHATDLGVPERASAGASGFDLRAAVLGDVVIPPGRWSVVPTGLELSIPEGVEAQVRTRSGLAARHGVFVLNSPGTIDSDYRGEILVVLANLADDPFIVHRGDRVAQLVFARFERPTLLVVESLDETPRGVRGLGSTGVK